MLQLKQLIVMGCLSERYVKELEQEIPDVDKYFGVNDIQQIIEELGGEYKKELMGERQTTTPSHYAYLKIAEGCNRTCSFCAIPLIRGKHKSRKMESIIEEAKFLATRGVKELILISQDLTYYGVDLYKKQMLSKLAEDLTTIEGIEWVRLHYLYPASFPLSLLDLMKKNEKIAKYIDIPIQHISEGREPLTSLTPLEKHYRKLPSELHLYQDFPERQMKTLRKSGHWSVISISID